MASATNNNSMLTNADYLSDSIQCCIDHELTKESSKTEVVITMTKSVKGQINDEQAELVIGKEFSTPIHMLDDSEFVV